jgi:RNA polymerase sigma-70 factor (ECF subfamily)
MNQESECIAKAQKGDQSAFGELVKTHHAYVFRVLYAIVRNEDEAKELSQLTWIKAWKNISSFKQSSAFTSWIYQIATRTALDHIRKAKRRGEIRYLDDWSEETEKPANTSFISSEPRSKLERKEIREQFNKVIAKLSPKHRTALMLREIEELSYGEIAKIMKCQTGTVMSRIFNARKSIQRYMKEFL